MQAKRPGRRGAPFGDSALRPLLAVAAALLLLALPLAGCGKKGSPERPPGSDFPRQYPSPVLTSE